MPQDVRVRSRLRDIIKVDSGQRPMRIVIIAKGREGGREGTAQILPTRYRLLTRLQLSTRVSGSLVLH